MAAPERPIASHEEVGRYFGLIATQQPRDAAETIELGERNLQVRQREEVIYEELGISRGGDPKHLVMTW